MSGVFDRVKKMLDEHDQQVDRALDKVREQIGKSTKNQYRDEIDNAVQFAKDHTGEGDTTK
ncbi:antitoxin [Planosporangium thailandense]|uniref:Antitoxin n=1 Tax=Planosporangium thailandense TaxID=765197 RepID=A0ABX0XSP5_9ACTN|nr:antitoxin [Planosporangium thailandense]NJC69031.1 antitoxin [Planosporangium thailandense]